MPQKVYSYKELENKTDIFFEKEIKEALLDLRKEFSRPLLNLLIDLKSDLQRIKKDDEERYYKTIKILEQKIPGFQEWNSGSQKIDLAGYWRQRIVKKSGNIPAEAECIQENERFHSLKTDAIYIRLMKSFKRVFFNISRGGYQFKKFIFRLFGSGIPEDYKWTQKIPLRNLIQYTFAGDHKWMAEFIGSENNRMSQILDFLIEKDESSESSVKIDSQNKNQKHDQKEPPTFRLSVILQLEQHIESAIQTLREYQADSCFKSEETLLLEIASNIKKAGTLELSSSKFSNYKIESNIELSIHEAAITEEKWQKYRSSQITDLKIQLELARFGSKSANTQSLLLEKTHLFFRDLFYLPIEKAISTSKEIISNLQKENESKKSDVIIEEVREQLNTEIVENSLSVMRKSDLKEQVLTEIRQEVSNLQLELNSFSEKIIVAEKRKPTLPVPELTLDDFLWQSIAARYLKDEAISKLDPDKQDFASFIEDQLDDLEEAAGIIDVNLLASIDSEVTEENENPLEIAISGLQRAVNTLEKSIKSVREKQNGYEELIKYSLPESLQKLADVMLRREYDKFELEDKARKVKSRALNWKELLTRYYAIVSEKTAVAKRFVTHKFNTLKMPVSRYLGLQSETRVTASEKQNLTEYLTGIDSIIRELPYIYQRLFSRSFLIEKRFFISPAGSLHVMNSAFEHWNKGILSTVAVIGEKGSGKSTLVKFFKEDLEEDIRVIDVEFTQTISETEIFIDELSEALGFKGITDVSELIERINNFKKRRIIIVEGLQNLYVRSIDGFGAINDFWMLMSQTSGNLFWMISCSRYAWEFFTKISNADQYFSQIVKSDNLDEDQIKTGILTRHKATGYELEFVASESLKRNRAYKKVIGDEQSMQDYLRNNYFEKLAKISEGNFSIAMILWIKSIKEHDDKKFIISPMEVADIDLLEVPSREVLFTLASLVKHDTLKADEVAKSLHQPADDAKLMLARLKAKGLVTETENGFMINHLVYRQVIRLLKNRNILH